MSDTTASNLTLSVKNNNFLEVACHHIKKVLLSHVTKGDNSGQMYYKKLDVAINFHDLFQTDRRIERWQSSEEIQ